MYPNRQKRMRGGRLSLAGWCTRKGRPGRGQSSGVFSISHHMGRNSQTAEASTATVLRRTYEQYWKHSRIKTQILLREE